MTKYLLLTLIIAGLWFTRPSAAIDQCESINLPHYCDILNAE